MRTTAVVEPGLVTVDHQGGRHLVVTDHRTHPLVVEVIGLFPGQQELVVKTVVLRLLHHATADTDTPQDHADDGHDHDNLHQGIAPLTNGRSTHFLPRHTRSLLVHLVNGHQGHHLVFVVVGAGIGGAA